MEKSYLGGSAVSSTLAFFLFSAIALALTADYIIDKELSADGVNYFFLTLELRDFPIADSSRRFAEYIIHWPLVLAVRSGLTDIFRLKQLFCLGLFLPYAFSFALSLYATRGEKTFLIIFPLVSMLGVNLASDFILAGEHQIMVLLSWPALLFSLRDSVHWSDAVLTWILLILISETYPMAAVTALGIAGLIAFRLHRGEGCQTRIQTSLNVLTLLVASGVFLITAYSILRPLHPANRDSFAIGIPALFSNPLAVGGLATTITYAWLLHRPTRIGWLFAWMPVIGYLIHLLTTEAGLSSGASFSSRTLTVTSLPIMMAAAVISRGRSCRATFRRSLPTAAFIVVGALGVIVQSKDWANYRTQFKSILASRSAFIPIEETPLRGSSYGWPWNNPLLSVVWSYPCVRSIILNAPTVTWQQFDPTRTLILKNYVKYARPLSLIDPKSTECE